jgi:hypothetical protein
MGTPSPAEPLDLLDVVDVQRITKLGLNKSYELMWAVGPVKLGTRTLRVRRADLDRYLESLRER